MLFKTQQPSASPSSSDCAAALAGQRMGNVGVRENPLINLTREKTRKALTSLLPAHSGKRGLAFFSRNLVNENTDFFFLSPRERER